MANESSFAVYVPALIAPGIFGETALIAAAYEHAGEFHLEAYVLIAHPERKLCTKYAQLKPAAQGAPVMVDLGFAVTEALNLGRLLAWEMQAASADKTAISRRFGFTPAEDEQAYLGRLWVRGYWLAQIRQIHKATECGELKSYIASLANVPDDAHHRRHEMKKPRIDARRNPEDTALVVGMGRGLPGRRLRRRGYGLHL